MVNLVQVDIEELIAFRADYAELKAENKALKVDLRHSDERVMHFKARLEAHRERGDTLVEMVKGLKAENDELKRENDGLKLGLQTKPGERVVLGDGREVALVYFKKSGD